MGIMDDNSYTDIHMHIIPGVDDGSEDLRTSVEMLRCAEKEGFRNIIATPHCGAFDGLFNKTKEKYFRLVDMAKQEGININLMLGTEIYVCSSEISKLIKKIKSGKYPTMNGTQHVLVEFDLCSDDFKEAEECIQKIVDAGYSPIIAHAEKYRYTTDEIYELAEQGCYLQVNFSDIIPGMFTSFAQEKADRMLKDQRVDFFSTDAHNMTNRPPIVSEAIDYLFENYDRNFLEKILYENPRIVLG